jgi:hypothetical protein
MLHRLVSASRLLTMMLLAVLLLPQATATRAASPGDELASAAGSLTASGTTGATYTTTIYSPGPANIRLAVAGGVDADKVTLSVQGGATPLSWDVRSGEASWAYAEIPSGGRLVLQNKSSKTLTFTLNAYARGRAPAIATGVAVWSGSSSNAGIQSAIQLDVPTSGLYSFTLNATSGSFQLVVDGDANYLRKTVKTGSAPAAADSVYYLSAGTHTFAVQQDAATAQTAWSMELKQVGGADAIPYSESSAVVGGGGFFGEEWIPLQVTSAQAVNLRIAVTGGANDSLTLELYDGTGKVFTSAPIFGGEIAWGFSALTAGANRLHIIANGNTAALSYTITASAVAQTPLTWTGKTLGKNAGGSSIRLNFPTAGLYRFNLSAAPGRYKLQLNGTYLQKIVTAAEAADFTAYVPAGSYPLVVTQDSAVASTDWSVEVSSASGASDALPFTRSGSTLTGSSAAFKDEWIPLQIEGGRPVNLTVTATGAVNDSIKIELYSDPAQPPRYTASTIFGSEVFWANTALTTGTNLLHIVAASGNASPISYQVEVRSIAEIPTSWQGVAHGAGLKSTVQVFAPADGVYNVVVTVENGAGQVFIDQVSQQRAGLTPNSSATTLRVPLSRGPHTFTFEQDSAAPSTTWQIATSLRERDRVTIFVPMVWR